MPWRRPREFLLILSDASQLLDCDDSDEDALFDMDAEDEEVLANNVPVFENEHVTVEIVDPGVVLPLQPVEDNIHRI